MTDILARLAAPFRPDQLDWRIGATNKDKTSGKALVYMDSRAVMHRLDEVCGHLWQCDYVPMPNGTYCCRIGIKIGDEWLWRSNGAINYPDSDKGDAKEMAVKGSYSDAFKRAAVLWGIGQYLYDIDGPWVDIVPKGNSHVFADGVRARLDRMIAGGAAPAQQTAPKSAATQAKPTDWDAWVKAAKAAIAKKTTITAIDTWRGVNEKALAALNDARPALWREVENFCKECADDLARQLTATAAE